MLALADRATAPGDLHDVIADAVEANAGGIRATVLGREAPAAAPARRP